MKRKNLFLVANIIIPLFIGLAIYLFCYKNTYINSFFENVFHFSPPYFYFNSPFHQFIISWLCDILWSYSLTFGLYFCFKDFNKPLTISIALAVFLAIVMESLQLFGYVSGTFDAYDIIFEIAAILLAVIIIKKEFLT